MLPPLLLQSLFWLFVFWLLVVEPQHEHILGRVKLGDPERERARERERGVYVCVRKRERERERGVYVCV
jgi:hypothetical protein